jgi:hypothetical protein
MTAGEATRRCEQCQRALPASARSGRRFCSASCRYKAWDAANRYEAAEEVPVRLHWHVDSRTILRGDFHAGYWRGEGCPPECGIEAPGYSVGVLEGREGIPPWRLAAAPPSGATPIRSRLLRPISRSRPGRTPT